MHFGPVYVTPTFGLKEIGIDTNVFNATGGPERDFTWTLAPAATAGLRLGRARLTTSGSVDFVFFRTFTDQNSVNQRYTAQMDLNLDRFRPFIAGELVKTRSRPGFEIDARARRTEPLVRGGVDVQVSPRTTFGVAARRSSTDFESGQRFGGSDLQRILNRHAAAVGGSVRYALTPLTTFVMLTEYERTRFDFEPLRDANSYRVTPGLEFSPDALLRGKAFVGYRRFKALTTGVPGYAGAVASAELATVFGDTRVEFRVDRDVAYSFEPITPYYVLSGVNVTATQRVYGPFDVTGTVGWQQLAYRALEGVVRTDRVDRVASAGGGVGFRLRPGTRLGMVAEYAERRSNAPDSRPFDRVRIYGTVTYAIR